MNKILKYQWIIVSLFLIILGFTLTMGFHFYNEFTIADIPKEPVVLPSDDEMVFQNDSSLTNDEVWNLVNKKKEELRVLFYETSIYCPSDLDSTKTKEDDDLYIAFDEKFLQNLNSLVSEDIYNEILSQMTKFHEDVNHQFYLANKNIFESIYLDSSIAQVGITSSSLRLISANDSVINSSVTISACLENKKCNEETNHPFELRFVNDSWKVSVFQNKRN